MNWMGAVNASISGGVLSCQCVAHNRPYRCLWKQFPKYSDGIRCGIIVLRRLPNAAKPVGPLLLRRDVHPLCLRRGNAGFRDHNCANRGASRVLVVEPPLATWVSSNHWLISVIIWQDLVKPLTHRPREAR